jgi:PAS domain S-box-containing protein
VDDEPEALLLTSFVLREEGYEVLEAATGEQCLQSVRAERPDLVLLDRMLPDADGVDVCRQIKSDPGLADTFVLLYSALKTTSAQQASGLESGADGYLVRPISNRELIARVRSILRLKQARDISRRSERRFRSLFENALVGIYRTTPDGKILLANPALLDMLGYASLEELAERDLERSGFGSVRSRSEFMEAIEREGQVINWESSWVRRDGEAIWVRESARAVRDQTGTSLYFEGIVEDITENRRAEQKFRDVFESAGDAILIHDLVGHILEANHVACQQLGYDHEDLLQMTIPQIDAPCSASGFDQRIRVLQEQGRAMFEGTHVTKDGSLIPIELNKRLIEYEGKQAVLSIARDITERVRVEEELRRYAERLEGLRSIDQAILDQDTPSQVAQAALQHIRAIVPCAGAWIMVSGPSGLGPRVLAAHFEHRDGRLARAFETLQEDALASVHEPGGPQVESGLAPDEAGLPSRAVMRAVGVRADVTVPIKASNSVIGQLVLVSDTARRFTPQEIEMAEELGAEIAVAVRQSELRAALEAERASLVSRVEARTAELRAANAELERAARLKDEFLATMSHELRTPLNAVLGLSESLLEGVYGPHNEKQVRALRTISESGRHLLDLINDVLDVAKIEAGTIELQLGMASIPSICRSCVALVKAAADKKQLEVTFSLTGAASYIEADGRRLKQILVNLLSNAVKFTPEGGRIGLRVHDDPAHDMTRFIVWDTGIGIAPEDVKRLFQPFVQVDSSLSRKYNGTGLGLALVRRLTEMHGGHVSVKSQVGVGSRFTVSLPRRAGTVLQTPSDDGDEPLAAMPAESGRCLVLLAEDDEINIATTRDYLEARGYRVIAVRDGRQAIRRAREVRPDVVLMDVQMPNMDGLEATHRLKADPQTAQIPVIALTALAMPGDEDRCLEAGADAYLSKPVRLRELVDVVDRYADRD